MPRLFLLPLAVLFSSCALHLPEPKAERSTVQVSSGIQPPVANARTVPVYLIADSLHTGLVFDQAWLEESGFVMPAHFGKHQWVTMSWGEETAYRQRHWLSPFQALRALGTPSASVMEIIPFDWYVEEVCNHQRVYVNEVPRSKGVALAAFLNGCAVKDDDGRPRVIDASSWGKGVIIRCPANYSYYFPRVCNVWTTQSLSKCGFTFNTSRALLANGVIRQAVSPKNGFRKVWDGDDAPGRVGKPSATPVLMATDSSARL
jgi:hypothetical protein